MQLICRDIEGHSDAVYIALNTKFRLSDDPQMRKDGNDTKQ